MALFLVLQLPPKKITFIPPSHKRETSPLQYEERETPSLPLTIKQIDLAILQAMVAAKLKSHDLVHLDIKEKNGQRARYLYQILQVRGEGHLTKLFLQELKKYLSLVEGTHIIKKKSQLYEIAVGNVITHQINLTPLFYHRHPLPFPTQGYIFLIIDDMGRDIGIARAFISLMGDNVTFSILPYERFSRTIQKLCKEKHVSILLHMPMEPLDYPRANPGPGALFADMTPSKIRTLTIEALHRVPFAIGVNNHMGSKFTQTLTGMKTFLEVLKKQKLFFIDSSTTPFSVAEKLGRDIHICVYKRDIFLDNARDPLSIVFQLKKAEVLSKKKGWAIAIGHPYKETLQGITLWLKTKDKGIRLVSVRDIKKIIQGSKNTIREKKSHQRYR